MFVALRAAVFGAAFVWFWGRAALSMRRFDGLIAVPLPEWVAVAGGVLFACGAIVAAACISLFVVRGHGTPAPFDAPRAFVAVGPYTVIRNPMYAGGWLMLVGLGLIERSVAMLAFSLAWLSLAHLFVALYEERTLATRFGASYHDYRRRVPRWIPGI